MLILSGPCNHQTPAYPRLDVERAGRAGCLRERWKRLRVFAHVFNDAGNAAREEPPLTVQQRENPPDALPDPRRVFRTHRPPAKLIPFPAKYGVPYAART